MTVLTKTSVALLSALLLVSLAHAQDAPPCDRRVLLDALRGAEPLPPGHQFNRSTDTQLFSVMLQHSALVMDGFRYSAAIDKTSGRAWVHMSGGYIGVSYWYGTFLVDPGRFSGCPHAFLPLRFKSVQAPEKKASQ